MGKRVNSAVAIRDRALDILRFESLYANDSPGQRFKLKSNGLTIAYDTPPLELPQQLQQKMIVAARNGHRIVHLGFGLNIWDEEYGGKVLNIKWSDEGDVDLISFRRGPWETKVLTFYNFFKACPSGYTAPKAGRS